MNTWKRSTNIDWSKEDHHRMYGREWCLGLDHYTFAVAQNLQPHDRLLDLGCGSGRSGIHFIDYLDKGNYVGVDGSDRSIEAFKSYEVPINRLGHKEPKIIHQNLVDVPLQLSGKFDFIFSYSVWNHIRRPDILDKIVDKYLTDNGTLILSHSDPSTILTEGGCFKLGGTTTTPSVLAKDSATFWSTYKRK